MAKLLKELEMVENDWYQFDTDELEWSLDNEETSYEEIVKAVESGKDIKSIAVGIKYDTVIEFDEESFEFNDLSVTAKYSDFKKGWELTGYCYADICDDYTYCETEDNYDEIANGILDDSLRLTQALYGDIYSLCDFAEIVHETYATLEEALNDFSSVLFRVLDRVNCKAQLCAEVRAIIDENEE